MLEYILADIILFLAMFFISFIFAALIDMNFLSIKEMIITNCKVWLFIHIILFIFIALAYIFIHR
jgi:hypothetical protein